MHIPFPIAERKAKAVIGIIFFGLFDAGFDSGPVGLVANLNLLK